jgi:hypothetical protein
MILETHVLFKEWEKAENAAEEIAGYLSSDTWYSTQTLGYMLLAMGKFLQAVEGEGNPLMKGKFILPDGKVSEFDTRKRSAGAEISSGFGGEVRVILDPSSTVQRAFAALDWNGVPLEGEAGDLSRNVRLEVEWLYEEGTALDPSVLDQGKVFWLHIRVQKSQEHRHPIDEAALVQLLPAGWEVENIRLSGEDLPAWSHSWNLHQEEYEDIRDDRVLWFFDFPQDPDPVDFVLKLRAVTAGRFTLPPTQAEAMYNTRYQARKAGYPVSVKKRK